MFKIQISPYGFSFWVHYDTGSSTGDVMTRFTVLWSLLKTIKTTSSQMMVSADLTLLSSVLEFTLSQSHLPVENTAQYSAAVAIHTVPVFLPPGTQYCWVDRGGVDSKLAQGFDACPALWELNPRPLDLGSYTLTTRSHVPHHIFWYSGALHIFYYDTISIPQPLPSSLNS